MSEKNLLTLENLKNGGAIERFHMGLEEALENILNPNTPATTVRTITLKMKIKPNKTRDRGETTVEMSVSLAPLTPIETNIIIDKNKKGKAVAAELHDGEIPGQQALFDMNGKITTLERKEA